MSEPELQTMLNIAPKSKLTRELTAALSGKSKCGHQVSDPQISALFNRAKVKKREKKRKLIKLKKANSQQVNSTETTPEQEKHEIKGLLPEKPKPRKPWPTCFSCRESHNIINIRAFPKLLPSTEWIHGEKCAECVQLLGFAHVSRKLGSRLVL